jgi:D-serine deaminase-like pyridoxal phosphate-dependent protein
MFGIGMTLASGCGNKTLVRIGGGNLKSVVVLAIASACAYAMLWTNFYDTVFGTMDVATTVNLAAKPARPARRWAILRPGWAILAFGAVLGLALPASPFPRAIFAAASTISWAAW